MAHIKMYPPPPLFSSVPSQFMVLSIGWPVGFTVFAVRFYTSRRKLKRTSTKNNKGTGLKEETYSKRKPERDSVYARVTYAEKNETDEQHFGSNTCPLCPCIWPGDKERGGGGCIETNAKGIRSFSECWLNTVQQSRGKCSTDSRRAQEGQQEPEPTKESNARLLFSHQPIRADCRRTHANFLSTSGIPTA